MEKNLKISVIIPAYNAEKTILKCLSSIISQKVKPFEIIVIDDGSNDKTILLAKKFAKVVKNVLKKGASGARNTGAKISKGDILAFTDSDCIVKTGWLKNISEAFNNKEIGAVGGGYFSGVNNSFWQRFCAEELNYRRRKWNGFVKTLVSNNMAVRKKVFIEEGGFPEQYPVCEDMLLSFKISQKYKVLWLVNNGVVHHFKNSLRSFLRHQYFFGKESTKFFLENPKVLVSGNHQGRSLHLAIALAFLVVVNILFLIPFIIVRNYFMVNILVIMFIFLITSHFFIYFGFIKFLYCKNFAGIFRPYLVSLLRDMVVSFSFFSGFVSFLKFKSSTYYANIKQ